MRTAAFGFVGLAALTAAPASAMTVADFLTRADVVQAKGMMALFSSDFRILKAEATDAIKAWHAQVAPPGRPRNACPPADLPNMTSDDVLTMLKAVPPGQRASISTADALVAGLNRRFPCPE